MDKATYLDPLKRKKKVGVEEALTSLYKYGKTKAKEAYKAASDSPGSRLLRERSNPIKTRKEYPGSYKLAAKVVTAVRPETPGSYPSKKSTSSGTYSGYGNRTSSAAYGNVPAKTARQYDTPIGPQKPKKTGVNQIAMGQSNAAAKAKKKAGATTSAAPAKPKRKSWFQRRQAERYAIGSSGKSL